MESYIPRIADKQLRSMLKVVPAVLIEGPKYVGKTETARQTASSEVLVDIDEDARLAAQVNPGVLLNGNTPRLIDEWQSAPAIWNHIRRECDRRNKTGQFILTGSSSPADDVTRHSGAGRIARLTLRPMSLFEQKLSDGSVSLKEIFSSRSISGDRPSITFDMLVEAVCCGGWPGLTKLSAVQRLEYCRAYIEEATRTELLSDITFDPVRMRKLFVSLARNIATNVTITTLQKDTDLAAQTRTISNYLNHMQRIHIVEPQLAFSTHLRSRAQLRLTPKLHYCDPSLAVAALRSNPMKLSRDLNYFGFLFESMVVRDLRVYADANDAAVYFYKDNTGLEIDAIVETASGSWIPIEVKLGGKDHIELAAKNLKRLRDKIDLNKVGEPAAMLVITATPSYAYTRPDGVSVVSISSLGP